jgi:hypothetical protein
MKFVPILCFLIYFTLPLIGQNLPPKQAYPLNVKQIHSGHSLTDPLFFPHYPGQYVNLMRDINSLPPNYDMNTMVGKSTIPGSPIRWRWANAPSFGPDARADIGDWELLSITEGVPLLYEGGSTQQWYLDGIQEQKHFLSLFVNNAWNIGNGGNGAPTLLWTTWTNIDDSNGPWRQMLDIQGAEFERMQDYANANRPAGAPPVYIIPGHKMMARLYDDIQLGEVPDINHINQFFSDNIHTNELGAYAISLIHYACIFNTSPVGLPSSLLPNPPSGTPIPSTELASYLQNMIWEVVTTYPRTGVTIALPVNFGNVEVTHNFDRNELTFTTLSEKNNAYFTIQRSANGIDFTSIGNINGQLNTSTLKTYSFTDYQPIQGVNYYRIKQTDVDEKYEYSKTVSVMNISALSNRLKSTVVHDELSYAGIIDHEEVKLFDTYGRLVHSFLAVKREIIQFP